MWSLPIFYSVVIFLVITKHSLLTKEISLLHLQILHCLGMLFMLSTWITLILDQLVYMKMFLLIQNPNLYIFLGCFLITKIRASGRSETQFVSKESAQIFAVTNG